MGPAAWP